MYFSPIRDLSKCCIHFVHYVSDIEAQIREIQSRKKEINEEGLTEKERVGLGESGFYDRDIYDGGGKYEGYVTSIAANDEVEVRSKLKSSLGCLITNNEVS